MKYTPNKIHIYSSTGKYIATQPYTLKEFEEDPARFFDSWDNSMIVTDTWYDFPCLDGTRRGIREMTSEERVTSGSVDLQDGQTLDLVTGKIVSTPIPEWLLKPRWNKEKKEWYEGSTHDELHEYIVEMSYKWRDERFEIGFMWKDKNGGIHHQRVRERDRSRFLETKAVFDITIDLDPNQTIGWQFSDTDTYDIDFNDLKEMLVMGGMLVQIGYRVNAAWRNVPKEKIDLKHMTRENFFKTIDDEFAKVMKNYKPKLEHAKEEALSKVKSKLTEI